MLANPFWLSIQFVPLTVIALSQRVPKASNDSGSPSMGPPVYMQGYRPETGVGTDHKLLVVNRRATAYDLQLSTRSTQ